MKRNWDVIRDLLLEVEDVDEKDRYDKTYGIGDEHAHEDQIKSQHALLLWRAGFIDAVETSTLAGSAISGPQLTWAGHELLETIRSKPVWEKIKTTAKDKGIELSFDAVIALGKSALAAIIGGSST